MLPRHQRDKLDLVQTVTQKLEHQLGRAALDQEIAIEMGLTVNDFHALVDTMVGVMPLDDVPEELMPEDPYSNPLEHIATAQLMEKLVEILKQLPEKQQLVLALHYQQELSYSEISAILNLTRGRISQLHTQAMLNIRRLLGVDARQEE